MVQLAFAFVVAALVSVQASPLLEKRIAQVIADSMTKWEAACESASGANSTQCNPLAVAAFGTLLAAAGPCDQQNAADTLIDFSKQQNSQEMIALAQVFCQHPRNTPNSVFVPYCQQPPKNAELNGLYQCQYVGANPAVFVGGLAVGSPGTIPFGMTSPVSPPGSCPANPSGPIPAGTQLSDITTNPFASGGSGTPSASSVAPSASSGTAADPEPDSCPAEPDTQTPTPTATLSTAGASTQTSDLTASLPAPMPTQSTAASPSSGFVLANGKAAQQLNAQYATLTADSSCNDDEDACVNGDFAQCVNGKFVLQSCSSTLSCFALPLVNKSGTSTTCTTEADAEQRIANTGATGGITGSGE